MVGLEIYPVNTDEYRYLHECGADYVTVFQETYDADKYETLHLMGHKRVWPYRFDSQERAPHGRNAGRCILSTVRALRLPQGCTGNSPSRVFSPEKIPTRRDVTLLSKTETDHQQRSDQSSGRTREALCQILCAYRIFLPFAGITVSSRESADFRNGIVKIAATKVSAGVSTGIGDHESKYSGKTSCSEQGDEQFEINDNRSLEHMYSDIEGEGPQPVLNDYLYV